MTDQFPLNLHPEFVKERGEIRFVKLPYDEFLRIQELLEDLADSAALREVRALDEGQPTYSAADIKKEFGLK